MISTEEQAQTATQDQLMPILISIGAIDQVTASRASAKYLCLHLHTICHEAENSPPNVQWATVESLLRASAMPRLLRLLLDIGPICQIEQLSEHDSRQVSQQSVLNFFPSKSTRLCYLNLQSSVWFYVLKVLAQFCRILGRHDTALDLVREACAQSRQHGQEMLQMYLNNPYLFLTPQGPRQDEFEDRRLELIFTIGPLLAQLTRRNGKMNHVP